MPEVLQLDVSGRPQAWMSVKEAATLYAAWRSSRAARPGKALNGWIKQLQAKDWLARALITQPQ